MIALGVSDDHVEERGAVILVEMLTDLGHLALQRRYPALSI
jgi:hypothetical protein